MSERPLLTLAICCYKFERFIDEALDGAFDQTYRPLEIVVSDDCSPDGSWQHILDKVASRFPNAPLDRQADCQTLVLSNPSSTTIPTSQTPPDFLSLTLNRNPTNLGLARHENRLFELSHGEWIAFQSGDDVSVPNRLERIAEVVLQKPQVKCAHSRCDIIDQNSAIVGWQDESISNSHPGLLPYILGASAVYHRDVYWAFGSLSFHVSNEDQVFPVRAKLLGDIYFFKDPLVRYRKHDSNLSGSDLVPHRDPEGEARYRLRVVYAYYQLLNDLHCAEMNHLADVKKIHSYRREVEDRIFAMSFLGNWQLRPENRWLFCKELFFSGRKLRYFTKCAISRIWRKFL